MADEIEKKYIVIVFNEIPARNFLKLINCDAATISKYVKSLTIGADIRLCFFGIDRLNDLDTMDVGDADVQVVMNSDKTFSDFEYEVNEAMNKLEIQKEDE